MGEEMLPVHSLPILLEEEREDHVACAPPRAWQSQVPVMGLACLGNCQACRK